MSGGRTGISVLIPAHNEADRIGATVAAARSIPGVSEVIVIDDGSTDATADAAAAANIVEVLPKNLGKGAALSAGLSRASCQLLLLLDADLGESAAQASALARPVISGEAAMTVAVFPELTSTASRKGRSGGFGLALRLARSGIKAITGQSLSAPLSGQRALVRSLPEQMGGFFPGFGVETALSGWAAAAGLRVVEVPLEMTHRRTGKDLRGAMHRARQLAHIARALIWLVMNAHRARKAGRR